MHELHTALFRSLLPPDCDLCGQRAPEACARSFALSGKGYATRVEDPSAVVTWPRCPRSYDTAYQYGQDLLPIDAVVAWEHERGTHRSPYLGAGGSRLLREWHRLREAPAALRLARDAEERRLKAQR